MTMPAMVPAQTVTVQSNDQRGHGYLFRHLGACYVVMPKHVANGQRRVRVFTSAPVEQSGSVLDTPFWDGLDLAVGQVRGPIEDRCTETLNDLLPKREANEGAVLELLRIRDSGEIERIPMVVTDGGYLTFEADTRSTDAQIFKGTSGAFLFDGDQPLGMAVEALTETSARFVRAEEIHMNVQRRLNRRVEPVASAATSSIEQASSADEIPYRVAWTTLPPLYPDQGEENLYGDGSYVFELTRPNTIALKIESQEAVPLSQIALYSDPLGPNAMPREISIEISPQTSGARKIFWGSGSVGIDGVFVAKRPTIKASWIFATIKSSHNEGPVAISKLEVR